MNEAIRFHPLQAAFQQFSRTFRPDLKSIDKKTVLMEAENVVFTTTFSGQKPLAAKWTDKDGKDLSTGTSLVLQEWFIGAVSTFLCCVI